MPSLISQIMAIATCIAMVTGTAIPLDPSEIFEKRAIGRCPAIDNTKTSGGRFVMRCNLDTKGNGGQEKTVTASGFEDCMVRCENSVNGGWCKFAAFPGDVYTEGPCYLKAGNGGGYNTVQGTKLGIRL